MKNQTLTNLILYRWRYVWGYGALILLFVAAVLTASLHAPGGLSQHEIDMIGVTNQIHINDLSTFAVTDLPFHLLQYGIFSLLGVSILTAKLPAIILSIAVAVSLFFLLRRWFRSNVAILAMLIMVATGQLIFLSQSFTSGILYVLYTSLILLFASLIVQRANRQQLWKIALAITIGCSLFTPYFWYINLGLFIVAIIHPHPRHFLLRRKYRTSWLPAISLGGAIVALLVYFGMTNPTFSQEIFGVESLNFNLLANASALLRTYIWVQPIIMNGQITPIMDVATLALIILGLAKTIQERSTARAYMIWIWLLLALPLLLIRPDLTAVVTVPLFILLAIGVETLLREWYGLFPKNPYARGVGLVLIIGLVSVMMLSGIERYTHGYKYTPTAVSSFNTDLPLFEKVYNNHAVRTVYVSQAEAPLYQAFSLHNTNTELNVEVESSQFTESPSDTPIAVTHAARNILKKRPNAKQWQLLFIVTNDRSVDADRLYIYKSHEK